MEWNNYWRKDGIDETTIVDLITIDKGARREREGWNICINRQRGISIMILEGTRMFLSRAPSLGICTHFFPLLPPPPPRSKRYKYGAINRDQLTLPALIILLHVAPGFFDALSSAQSLPLVNAVRRHRGIVVSRLVPVVLRSCPTTLVRSRTPIIVILRNHRSGRGGCGGGGRCGGRRAAARRHPRQGGRGWAFVFWVLVLVLGVVLRRNKSRIMNYSFFFSFSLSLFERRFRFKN